MHFKSLRQNFHLDPALEGAAGGAAPAGSPVSDAAPAFDASQYVPKAEFEAIQSDYQSFRQTAEQRFQDYDSRLPKPAPQEAKADKEPDAESGDYDFSKPGEFNRYQRELAQYHLNQTLSERETKQAETRREQGYKQYVQSTQDAHADRADSFRAANPDYDPNKSILVGNDAVALAILESDFSAHIHNFLQKNPDKVTEIRKLASTNPARAITMVGRIEAQFESQAAAIPAKKSAAGAMPTAGAFGGNKPSGQKQSSKEEIFDKWNT